MQSHKTHFVHHRGSHQLKASELPSQDSKGSEKTGLQLEYGVSRVLGGRPYQEDEYTCVEQNGGPAFFAVFDGHGSDYYSAHASSNVYKMILDQAKLADGGKEIDDAIRSAFEEEDKITLQALKEEKGKSGGSTATVAVIAGDELHVGNVGDSTAVLGVERDGKLHAVRVSRDHKPEDPEERARIEKAGGLVMQGRVYGDESAINMSRALGDHEFKTPLNDSSDDFISGRPYLSPAVHIDEHVKFLVLASDGVWNQANDQEVIDAVDKCRKAGQSASVITEKITKQCASPPMSDNVTMILVFFNPSPSPSKPMAKVPKDAEVVTDGVVISKHSAGDV
eukprot:TRINITY_DN568_c0_g2_i3.p1 TRINITY_DN568_c0_g2~~TRINITY_DN568_c0_g2_i3.p1  ORF type:complete len:358 (-),score=98.65 TRINITY_DN568_c0_g2_i3:269-1279(-)